MSFNAALGHRNFVNKIYMHLIIDKVQAHQVLVL